MRRVKVGILGLGTVGSALANIIVQSRERVLEKYGLEIEVTKVFVRNLNKKRNIPLQNVQLTDDPYDIVNDKEIAVICECIGGGGTELSATYIIDAIKSGKHIVLSSKKVLALFSDCIFKTAQETNSIVKYDATVGGGIPTHRVINSCLLGEKIYKVAGIVNATSNFIYSQMMNNKSTFEDALAEAQTMGYVENDPDEDILGYDALYKLSILIMMCMNKRIDIESVHPLPIVSTTLEDMIYAEKLGYSIKPIIYGECYGDVIKYVVGPCLVNKKSVISNVFLNNNIICINGSSSGNLFFCGQGAGGFPTASAMFDDLVNIFFESKKTYNMPQYAAIEKKAMKRYLRIEGEEIIIRKCLDASLYKGLVVIHATDKEVMNNKKEYVLLTDSLSDEEIQAYVENLKNNNITVVSTFFILDDFM